MRTEPCICGGSITAEETPSAIKFAVAKHNDSFEHLAFALRLWPHPCDNCGLGRTSKELCHSCDGRYAGPLTVDRLASLGLARV